MFIQTVKILDKGKIRKVEIWTAAKDGELAELEVKGILHRRNKSFKNSWDFIKILKSKVKEY